jgi:hypothetical protein
MADDEFVIEESTEANAEAYDAARAVLLDRCAASGISASEVPGWENGDVHVLVEMPSGREKYPIRVVSLREAETLLAVPFEKYTMLGEYFGVCSYAERTIEVAIRHLGTNMPSPFLKRRLGMDVSGDEEGAFEPIVLAELCDDPVSVSIGDPTADFMAIGSVAAVPRFGLTIRIQGSPETTLEDTIRFVEKVADSLFFQVDLQSGVPMGLQRDRRRIRRMRRRSPEAPSALCFPTREYEGQPISLYWYGRGAAGMPLLQFLAFYQVLEFFMPTYSNRDAMVKVQKVLKDPRFSPDKDAQVARVLAAIRGSARESGGERSMLEAVIRHCLTADELRAFLTAETDRKTYFVEEYKPVALQKLSIESDKADLLNEVAHRLYQIRCRIVHTKDSGGDKELPAMLPYSREARDLVYDIGLIQYVATEVLVASSSEFRK